MRIGTVADLKDHLTEIHAMLRAAHDARADVRRIGDDAFVISTPGRASWLLHREIMRVLVVGPVHPPSIVPDVLQGIGCDAGGGIALRVGTHMHTLAESVLPPRPRPEGTPPSPRRRRP